MFNFILAFVLAVIIVGFVGYDPSEVVEVEKGSPVAEAGLEKGDVITEYDGYHVDLAKDLYVYMYLNNLKEGDTVTMKVKRDGETKDNHLYTGCFCTVSSWVQPFRCIVHDCGVSD